MLEPMRAPGVRVEEMKKFVDEAFDQVIGVPQACLEQKREMLRTCASTGTAAAMRVVGSGRVRLFTPALAAAMLAAVVGMQAVEGWPREYGFQDVLGRVHKKRRNQTQAYHRRIQKKWDKRYGNGLQTWAGMGSANVGWGW